VTFYFSAKGKVSKIKIKMDSSSQMPAASCQARRSSKIHFVKIRKLSAPHYKQHYKRFRNRYQRKGSPSRRSRSSLNLAPSSTLKSSDPTTHFLPPSLAPTDSYKTKSSAAEVFAVPQSCGISKTLTNGQGRRDPVIP